VKPGKGEKPAKAAKPAKGAGSKAPKSSGKGGGKAKGLDSNAEAAEDRIQADRIAETRRSAFELHRSGAKPEKGGEGRSAVGVKAAIKVNGGRRAAIEFPGLAKPAKTEGGGGSKTIVPAVKTGNTR
jgi:hypothetical protein